MSRHRVVDLPGWAGKVQVGNAATIALVGIVLKMGRESVCLVT